MPGFPASRKARRGDAGWENSLNSGARLVVVEGEELALMHTMGKEAGIRWMGNGVADIQIPKNVTRAGILEEPIHYQQYLKYGEDYMHTEIGLLQAEIEAQNELLRIGSKEYWSTSEMDRIRAAKTKWEGDLKKIKK